MPQVFFSTNLAPYFTCPRGEPIRLLLFSHGGLVRKTSARIFTTLAVALSLLVAATYWLSLPHTAQVGWPIVRSGIILVGVLGCMGLGFHALKQDWRHDRNELLALVQAQVLNEKIDAPLTQDTPSDARAAIEPLQQHVTSMRRRVQELSLQRQELEIQLRLAEAEKRQTQTLLNGITDAVMVTNEFDELLLANPAAAALFGFQLPQAIRRPIAELLPHSRLIHDIAELRTNYTRTARRTLDLNLDDPADAAAPDAYEGENADRKSRPNGTALGRSFTVTLAPVADQAEQFTGVVSVLHETTRERQIARLKSDFVSLVSHELRTPLSSIKAYAELLVDGEANDDKTRSEFYHVIQNESERLSRLIDNILNISRIESGMVRIAKSSVSLTTILKQVLDVAMPTARDKNITLLDQVAPAFYHVMVDRDMIYQAALNLVSNAIKYTPAGGTIKVATHTDQEARFVTVAVHDTGVGIPPEAMAHLFEKFYRVEAHKSMAKGSGLGLHLTRQIIENVHEGKLEVQSRPGAGSTFSFTLPILA